ncbi:hypothetical protein PAHAL_2G097600 [Panicum hallii]|uniref:Uncharacterized protein n=1 Tax=Panicum hallii TaxID=206008 RepID=A0A2S3GX44_9POAL|nr:putative F-box protein At3g58860 [Panicum hallii]PAN10508.1 hypothetical protein PAHAL_2G097600 [Panicum hallii]
MATEAPRPKSTGKPQWPPPSLGAGEEGGCCGGIDRISGLPDAILGEIISLLPIKDAARTQALASRWRHLWRSAPLSLDGGDLPAEGEVSRAGLISRILAAHPGPARRFSVSALQLLLCPSAVDSWICLPALDGLRELEFHIGDLINLQSPELWLPDSAFFRFSATLRLATISKCHILKGTTGALRFPQLRELALESVRISEDSLQSMIAGSPVLECLLLSRSVGFRRVRINSQSLVSISVRNFSGELIIENAPSLERLLQLGLFRGLHVSVIAAPKLETLGWISDRDHYFKLAFGTTAVQNLRSVSTTAVVRSVKILAVDVHTLSLDTVLDLMRCFPCLEKLYIELFMTVDRNSWRRKHHDVIGCLDIRLKTVVLKNYCGIKSHVNFASFFVLNAKILESMTFEGGACHNQKFIAEQHSLLELEKRVSRSAQFYFTVCRSWDKNLTHIKHVHDLSITDPFEYRC